MTDQIDMSSYDAKDIQVLEGLEAVRRRPGMYVGGTDGKALHHLVYEVVDNSIDEALANFCDRIEVVIHADSSVTVTDNGRGIPVDIHPDRKKPALEIVMTVLHAGGKFGGGGYKVSGGLHGVGLSAVNALSEWFEVEVKRDGKVHYQRYERGRPVEPVQVIGKVKKGETGTRQTFKFDPEIFTDDIDYRFETLVQRLREMAFVTRADVLRTFEGNDGHGRPTHVPCPNAKYILLKGHFFLLKCYLCQGNSVKFATYLYRTYGFMSRFGSRGQGVEQWKGESVKNAS